MDLQVWHKLIVAPTKSILSLHTKPDGDSIGSNLALLRILQKSGHQVTLITRDEPPQLFSFLPGFGKIQQVKTTELNWHDFDIFWALDMSSLSMLDEQFLLPNMPIAVIDHHSSNTGWGTYNLIEPNAVSTTQVLYKLFTQLDIDIDPATASCLYTGLMTDTFFMKYVDEVEPFQVAARLLELGADSSQIRFNIDQQIDVSELKISSEILSRAEKVGPCITIVYPHEVVSKNQLTTPAEYVVEYASQIANTDFGLIMFEEEPNIWRLEFRSHELEFDVSKIAKQLGGGGHVAAAGVRRIEGTQAQILERILATCRS